LGDEGEEIVGGDDRSKGAPVYERRIDDFGVVVEIGYVVGN
jgi:hypothetical protein